MYFTMNFCGGAKRPHVGVFTRQRFRFALFRFVSFCLSCSFDGQSYLTPDQMSLEMTPKSTRKTARNDQKNFEFGNRPKREKIRSRFQ